MLLTFLLFARSCKIKKIKDGEFKIFELHNKHCHGPESLSLFPQFREITSPVKAAALGAIAVGGAPKDAIDKAREINSHIKSYDVYNLLHRFSGAGQGLTEWQALDFSLRKAADSGVIHVPRFKGSDAVAVFITSLSCVEISHAYPQCMQLDSTFGLTLDENQPSVSLLSDT